MKREILFKALRVSNNQWVQGHYMYDLESSRHIIVTTSHYSGDGRENPPFDFQTNSEVHPETVCQYTGLKDKDGNKIFEGDTPVCNGVKYKLVRHVSGCYELYEIKDDGHTSCSPNFLHLHADHMEITGNIHDKKK